MSLQRFAPAAIAAACLAVCASANASDALRISGFGTIGAVHTSNSEAQFVTPGQPGEGATNSGFKFNPDTKLGIQANYQINPMFSGTAQILTKENGQGNWNPSLEWAFVKAQITPEWSARAGRIGTPFFLISDFRDVGYANLWVRPPLEVYGQVPVSNFNGMDVTYQKDIGTTTVSATVFAGPSRAYVANSKVKLDNNYGLNTSAQFDNGLTLRFGYAQSKLSIESAKLDPLISGLDQLAAAGSAGGPLAGLFGFTGQSATAITDFSDQLNVNKKRASFIGVGASWDHGNWLVSGEYTKRKTNSYVADTTGWYASVGYRVGKFTPFIYASKLKTDRSPSNPITPLLAASYSGAAQLSAGADTVLAGNDTAQKAIAIGTRWDVFSNVALKAQIESIRPESRQGLFLPVNSTVIPDLSHKTINVLSLSADFVF